MILLSSRFMKIIILSGVIGIFCFFQTQQAPLIKKITPAAYVEQVKPGDVLIDVRSPGEFEEGHVEKAVNSDFNSGQFAVQIKGLDKTKTYYLYCASGNRSGKAAKLMLDAGFTEVYNLGSYNNLKEAGLPTTQEK